MNRQRAIQMTENDFAVDRVIISISNFNSSTPVFNKDNHAIQDILFLQFNDWDDGNWDCMSQDQASAIANFVNRYWNTDNQIVVHCDGGVSRSAGVAAAILKFFTNDDTAIFNNYQYCPNMWCYRQVLQALEDSQVANDED